MGLELRIGLQMLSWYDGVVPPSDDESGNNSVRLRLSYPEISEDHQPFLQQPEILILDRSKGS